MSDPAERSGLPGTWEYLTWRRDGGMHLDRTRAMMPASDADAALHLKMEFEGELHYVPPTGTWYRWDGMCHRPDDQNRIAREILAFAYRYQQALERCRSEIQLRYMMGRLDHEDPVSPQERRERYEAERKRWEALTYDEQNAELDADEKEAKNSPWRKEWEKWAPQYKYAAGLKTAKGAAALESVLARACSVSPAELEERWPRWVNCESGLVALEPPAWVPEHGAWTAGSYGHDPKARATYCVRARYAPGARCPQFLKLVRRMCGGDEQVAWYLVKVLGYAMLGENPERKIIFINGPTSSGKTMVLHIVAEVLGTLAHPSQSDLICVVRHGRNARTENSIRGRRFITITETSNWMHIDEGQVKRLTGEKGISVDQHYAKAELETKVTWTIIIATNKMPAITDYDEGMQERVIVIPAGETIPENERDPRLAETILATERDAIFTLLVSAAREYHASGLEPPTAVVLETDRYRGRQDTVANFIRENCVVSGGDMTTSWKGLGHGSIGKGAAYRAYVAWSRGDSRLIRDEFHEQMASQPGVTLVDNGGSVQRYEGLMWTTEAAAAWAES